MNNEIKITTLERIIDLYNVKKMIKDSYSLEYIDDEIEQFEKEYNVSIVNNVLFIDGRDSK